MIAEQVHPGPVEPAVVQHGPGQKGTDHEMQAGPVAGQSTGGQPDQGDIPAVTLGQAPHQGPDRDGRDREADDKGGLPTDPLPVQHDQRQHAPDGDVVEAGIAQDALAERPPQDVELFHEQHQDRQGRDRAGHADAEDHLPFPGSCSGPAGKAQQTHGHNGPQCQGRCQGQSGGNPGLDPMRPGLAEVQFQTGDEDEDHHRPPGHAVQRHDHLRIEDRGMSVGEGGAEHTGAQQDAGDYLHHNQRCIVLRSKAAPDQIGHAEDDQHGHQKELGRVQRVCQDDLPAAPMAGIKLSAGLAIAPFNRRIPVPDRPVGQRSQQFDVFRMGPGEGRRRVRTLARLIVSPRAVTDSIPDLFG